MPLKTALYCVSLLYESWSRIIKNWHWDSSKSSNFDHFPDDVWRCGTKNKEANNQLMRFYYDLCVQQIKNCMLHVQTTIFHAIFMQSAFFLFSNLVSFSIENWFCDERRKRGQVIYKNKCHSMRYWSIEAECPMDGWWWKCVQTNHFSTRSYSDQNVFSPLKCTFLINAANYNIFRFYKSHFLPFSHIFASVPASPSPLFIPLTLFIFPSSISLTLSCSWPTLTFFSNDRC